MAIVLVATLDTKGAEIGLVRDLIAAAGLKTCLIDAGVLREPSIAADVPRAEVFERAGTTLDAVRSRGDRGEAVIAAARGVKAIVEDWASRGEVDGILAIGGSAGTVIGTTAMRALAFGIPKVMVSTLASGQTRPYVGGSDVVMVNPVADVAGLNRLTRRALANAAHALVGMVRGQATESALLRGDDRPVVAATMFGVTTPCVDRARQVLEGAGFEVLVFHATGVGGQAMESLIRDGMIAGVLDLTTTELADELVGGVLTAGPERLEAAARRGVPQVVSVGALDMVNFGPKETVPERFAGRLFHVHNPSVTLMRTTPAENAELGARMAQILRQAQGPVRVLIPLRGVSALDAEGKPFFDPDADAALFQALTEGLAGASQVQVDQRDEHINDATFAEAAAGALLDLMRRRVEGES